jgi:hypothetical protein
MKKKTLFAIVTGVLLLIVLISITSYILFSKEVDHAFYVGVTYGGSSIEEAKELVDQVKGCTNLFILASGTIQNASAVEEIGDYAIASGLNFAVYNSENVYYGNNAGEGINQWANNAKKRWKEHFIGIYYRDEPGGEMLDGKTITLEKTSTKQLNGETIITQEIVKTTGNIIVYNKDNSQGRETVLSQIVYRQNGEVFVRNATEGLVIPSFLDDGTLLLWWGSHEAIHYYPNGTITIGDLDKDFYTVENITKCPLTILPYEQVLQQNPIQTHDDAANAFVNMNKQYLADINKKQLTKESITVFTADYGLYWWEYQSGYDIVLAEFGWNNSITQEISLVRGAATFHNKQWGAILTWKYTQPPYLTNGEEMFEQMKTAYQTGAQYVIIFNYSEDIEKPNTLQEEHFQALERFWSEVVQNPKVTYGTIKAEAVLVLPKNYGWGLRSPNDHMWGLWPADNNAQEIWNQIQNKIDKHGLKLDIVFEEPNYFSWNYNHIYYYWNQK